MTEMFKSLTEKIVDDTMRLEQANGLFKSSISSDLTTELDGTITRVN